MFRSSLVRLHTSVLLTIALLVVAVTSSTGPSIAFAAKSTGCESGDFRVTLPNGTVLSGNNGWKLAPSALPANSRIAVRGRYVEFDVDVSTLAVYNYTLTAAANSQDLTGGVRTTLFASKVADLGGKTLDAGQLEVKLSPQTLELLRSGNAGKMKIQAKDCATGGVFQMEPETGGTTTITHTLAPGMFYFKNPYTGKINFGNGGKLRGKDSPQVATRLSQTDTVTVWSVASGGRMGGVLGEDAVEASAGAITCVQDCQAQNQIRGSLPVTDPFFNS
jgi:hypothetical protein